MKEYHKKWRTVKDKRKIPKLTGLSEKQKKAMKKAYKKDGMDRYRRRTRAGAKPGSIYRPKRIGTIKSMEKDLGKVAKLPGKRISKTGHIYYEYRKNRSDKPNKDY